jgi:predicted nucleotidyltransferase
VRLALFGSVARGDADADSDVDLMAEFDNHRVSTILTRVHLENRIGISRMQQRCDRALASGQLARP